MEYQNQYARNERFTYPIRAIKSLSTDAIWTCLLWKEWVTLNIKLMNKTSEIARLAAQGIVEEGKLLDKEAAAQEMAEELIRCGDDKPKIKECAVKLYSKETFLYKVLNATLRNNDMSKVTTLGPLCFLLNSYLSQRKTLIKEQTIYRGMTLTDEMIEEYCEAVDMDIGWPAFTSTTQNQDVAEMFAGNTLCIIKLAPGLFVHGADISGVSCLPEEEEFLLSVGFMLQVERVEIDPTKKKHLIYLKSISHL